MNRNDRKRSLIVTAAAGATLSALVLLPQAVKADTLAWWRFEAGPAETNVVHGAADGVYAADIPDASGHGNALSAWTTSAYAGFAYKTSVPTLTGAPTNNFSIKNTGGVPGMFTNSSIDAINPAAFTIEASWRPEGNNSYRTLVGRDARNVATSSADLPANNDLAALYLQAQPDQSIKIQFTDMAGNTHAAVTAAGYLKNFTGPNATTADWYNLAAISDGSTLKLYVNGALAASSNIITSDPRLATGSTSGGDWHAGGWSVGRGMYGGGHADRGYGFIDEVRISDSALALDQLLVPIQSQIYTWTAAAGAFTTGSNWDKGTVPQDINFHQAQVNNGGTIQITAGTMNVSDLWVGTGSSAVGHVTQTGGTLMINQGLVIGRAGGTGDYDISSGTLSTGGITAANGGSSATMTIRGNSTVDCTGGISIAGGNTTNTGTLIIRDTAKLTTSAGIVIGTGGTLSGGTMIVRDSANVTVNGGQALRIADVGNSTLVVQDTAQLNLTTSELWVANGLGSTATATISGGTVTVGNWLAVGRDRGAGTLTLSGTATINKTLNGNITIGAIGNATDSPIGVINQTGGSIVSVRNSDPNSEAPGFVGGEVWLGESAEGRGVWNFSGGSASAPAIHLGYFGASTLNMSGTAQMTTDFLSFARGGNKANVANLGGGTITTPQVARGGSTGALAVNLNGSTVIAASDNDRFITGFKSGELNLQSGGAVINTNGKNVGIDSPLSGTGPLVKNGAGVLTMNAGANHTYSGATVINSGTLKLQRVTADNSLFASNVSAFYKFDNVVDDNGAQAFDDASPNAARIYPIFSKANIVTTTTVPAGHTGALDLSNNVSLGEFLSTADGNTPASFPKGNDSYTIAAWINLDGNQTNNRNGIVSWGDKGGSTNPKQRSTIDLRTLDNAGTPNGLLQSWHIQDQAANAQSGTNFVNQWHHVTAVYDAATDIRRLYVDGVLIGERYDNGVNNASSLNFAIGQAYTDELFSGYMADMFIARSALSTAQIGTLMTNGVSFGTFTGASGALSSNSLLQIAGGATLDLNGSSSGSGGLSDIGGVGGVVTSTSAGNAVLGLGPVGAATFGGVIQNGTGTVGITKTGTGIQTLSGNNTYTGTTTVQGGTLVLAGNAKNPALNSGADVQAGKLVFDYTGGSAPDVRTKIKNSTIHSSTATSEFGLGYVDDTAGQKVTVAYTYFGDADLNGKVNTVDFNALAGNFGASSGKVWAQGDFNYDDAVNSQDFNALAANYGKVLVTPAPSLGAVVPEPMGLSVVVAGAFLGLARRRGQK